MLDSTLYYLVDAELFANTFCDQHVICEEEAVFRAQFYVLPDSVLVADGSQSEHALTNEVLVGIEQHVTSSTYHLLYRQRLVHALTVARLLINHLEGWHFF